MFSKKSQFFMLDVIFSFVIIVIAIGIAAYYSTSAFEEEGLFELSIDIMERFTTTSINSLNNEEIRNFFLTNQISNVDNSIAQQAGEFYLQGNGDDAKTLTKVFIETYERRNIFINISLINDSEVFELYLTPNAGDFNRAQTSYVHSREILILNNSKVHPYTVEVRTWQ